VLFLDDDVMIDETFLSSVRRYVEHRPVASVVTFRVLGASTSQWSSLVKSTISLDRGPEIRNTDGTWLRLQDVWRYGAGAAMLVSRSVLKATGGFKDQLGAGRRNGGAEDGEFLWHASRHAAVEYRGDISVIHQDVSSLQEVARKLREYGRAIGHLGGTTKSTDGYRYVCGYCAHLMKAAARLEENEDLPERSLTRVRTAIAVAVAESLRVYASSVVLGHQAGILCEGCRRTAP
jgi:hypothetical protein